MAQARAGGAVYAAFYSDVLGENRPVTASLVASIMQSTGGPPPQGADATAVAAALRNLFAADGEAEVRQLPAGPAVRVKGRVEAPAPGGTMAPVLNLRYFVPVPGLERIAALEFSTPNLALAEPFTELFDAIAGSLAWT